MLLYSKLRGNCLRLSGVILSTNEDEPLTLLDAGNVAKFSISRSHGYGQRIL